MIQTDASGNRSPAAIVTWTVDTTAPASPTVTRTSPVATPTNSTTQTITYAGAESGGTFQCKLDSASYAACPSSPAVLSGLTDGSHTYSVTQTDAAGNVSPAASVTWTVDTTPPAGTDRHAHQPERSRHQLHDSGDHLLRQPGRRDVPVLARFGAAHELPEQSGHADRPRKRPHTFSVTQTDALGNVGSAATVIWTVDLIPPAAPTVTRTSPTASPTNSATQTITFSGAEAGGTLQCKLDSAAYGSMSRKPGHAERPRRRLARLFGHADRRRRQRRRRRRGLLDRRHDPAADTERLGPVGSLRTGLRLDHLQRLRGRSQLPVQARLCAVRALPREPGQPQRSRRTAPTPTT